MPHPFEPIREKLARANTHYGFLKDAAKDAIEAHTNPVFVEQDGQWHVVKVGFDRLPALIGVISGDIIHNLRSALDHTVWQLVMASGSKPGRHTQFPIHVEKSTFENDVVCRDERRRGKGPLHGIAPAGPVWALFEHVLSGARLRDRGRI